MTGESNSQPVGHKSDALTTTLPSHMITDPNRNMENTTLNIYAIFSISPHNMSMNSVKPYLYTKVYLQINSML